MASQHLQNRSQYVRLLDENGQAFSSSNKIPVDATLDTSGLALDASLTTINTTLGGTLTVDGSAVTQPVSATALPLPTGACTETTLDAVKTAVEGVLSVNDSSRPPVSGTLWATSSNPSLNGVSSSIDCQYVSQICVFGDTNTACSLVLQVSNDNSTWFDSNERLECAANQHFYLKTEVPTRYCRLKTQTDLSSGTIQAYAAAK